MFKCLNCGFVFKNPEYKRKPIPKREMYIERVAEEVAVCPKCGSDAIKVKMLRRRA